MQDQKAIIFKKTMGPEDCEKVSENQYLLINFKNDKVSKEVVIN